MRVTIIANPAAGGGRACRRIRRALGRWNRPDWEPTLLLTRDRLHAGALALGLLDDPPDLLAVCGGDGTINEVVSCLPSPPPFPLAILPGGTANVMARELGLPLDPVRALGVALDLRVRRVDLGELRRGSDRRFLFVAGIGFDACAVARMRPRLKSVMGIGAYVVAVAECLCRYGFPEFEVDSDAGVRRATSCLVCNAKSYGGGSSSAPGPTCRTGCSTCCSSRGAPRRAGPLSPPGVARWRPRGLGPQGPDPERVHRRSGGGSGGDRRGTGRPAPPRGRPVPPGSPADGPSFGRPRELGRGCGGH